MRRFAALFESLDTTTSTLAKLDAMRAYFETADAADASWAVYVMIGAVHGREEADDALPNQRTIG